MRTIIIAAVALLAGCGSPSSTTSNDAAPAVEEKLYKIGDAAAGKVLEFTLQSVAQTSQVGIAGSMAPAGPEETYVVAKYSIKNIGKAPLTILERPAIALIDQDGQEYAVDDMAGAMAAIALQDSSGAISDLNPGVTTKSVAAWKLSKAAFNKEKWKLVVRTDPTLTFSLK